MVMSFPVAAQTSANAPSVPAISAAAILKKSCDAGGSEEARNAVRTLHITGYLEGPDRRGALNFEYFADASGKFVYELEYSGITDRSGFDGKKFWHTATAKSFPLLQPPDLPGTDSDLPVAESPLACSLRRNVKDARVMGKANVGGDEAVVVLLTDPHGNKQAVYIDTKTWLLVRSDGAVVHMQQNEKAGRAYTIYLSDYRSIAGIKIPFRKHQVTGAGETWEIKSKVEVNHEIDPRKFLHG